MSEVENLKNKLKKTKKTRDILNISSVLGILLVPLLFWAGSFFAAIAVSLILFFFAVVAIHSPMKDGIAALENKIMELDNEGE